MKDNIRKQNLTGHKQKSITQVLFHPGHERSIIIYIIPLQKKKKKTLKFAEDIIASHHTDIRKWLDLSYVLPIETAIKLGSSFTL